MTTQLAEDRQQSILEEVEGAGRVVISELAARHGVSEMTIRRDLKRLELGGLVRRVHGGAMAVRSPRFDDRLSSYAKAKGTAAGKLTPFLPANGMIYLDGSTTMLHLVGRLAGARELQVVTNNGETFRRLAALEGVRPLLIGGELDRRTDNLVGPLAARTLMGLSFDAAFFSAWGLRPALGLCEATVEDAEVKELVAARSEESFLAVDHSKLGVRAAGVWTPEAGRATLATDLDPEDERLGPLAGRFGRIL